MVDPASAISSVIALSNAAAVRICDGRGPPSRASSTARRPVASAAAARRASTAGIDAVPGRAIPSASTSEVIVDAVPISWQWPAEGTIAASSASYSAAVILPARKSAV